jgi:nitronate monooxygenase
MTAMTSPLHRPICDLLGCPHPIVLAGMGGVARSELVAAVTKGGGFGFLGMVREPVELIRAQVSALRTQGIEQFGVNLIPNATEPGLLEAQVSACIELGVPVVGLFWGADAQLVARLRAAGIVAVCQIGSRTEARDAERAGAQALIAQGVEAGGHVRGERPLRKLIPEVLADTALPVLAAGGLADGADLAAVLSLGAQGAVFGTALIATPEAFAHDYHKQRLIEANGGDTLLTEAFHINWPRGAKVRVIANSVTRGEHGDPWQGGRVVIGEEAGRPIYLFSTDSPLRSMTGEFEPMALYAGLGVGRVTSIVSATTRVRAIAVEAVRWLDAHAPAPDLVAEVASPPCFAHEVDDEYMGLARHREAQA